MFGLTGFSIGLAYLLCILSAILCVIYGIVNWNKGADTVPDEGEIDWEKKEVEIEDNL